MGDNVAKQNLPKKVSPTKKWLAAPKQMTWQDGPQPPLTEEAIRINRHSHDSTSWTEGGCRAPVLDVPLCTAIIHLNVHSSRAHEPRRAAGTCRA